MGSVKVTVYGRIKPCCKSPLEYKIKYGDEEDQITFTHSRPPTKRSFRFKKIFDTDATQEQVFESVASPVIKNFLAGYNGTIFTYGQTGSGKTYTMTGYLQEWLYPGLIPRIVQDVFKTKAIDTTVTISFCEIYNEHIYDLIRPDRSESDTTAVSMLTEANIGISNFRNLSAHKVTTAEEALQLFLRGDANKMIAETGSNFRSSRSHAIFSIGLELPHPTHENVRLKPVLYLVDLAGSEKLSKCKTPTSNASETRYINLSLHYLEQVLIALRQPGRVHIPYRNSLMTALLRNSLGGNSITIMIATLSVFKEDIEETIQTCRFAERIALIKNEVKLNELVSPEKEITYLKKENERLKAQLKLVCNDQVIEQLDEKEKEKCIEAVRNFIQDNDYFDLPLTSVRRMEYCFRIMRDEIMKERDFVICNDIKSKDVQLELIEEVKDLKNIKNDDSRLKLAQDNITTSNHIALKKKNSAEIPKVNIVYEDPKSKESSEGKENKVPKNNKEIITNKVRFSTLITETVDNSKVRNSTQLQQLCSSYKLKDCSLNCDLPKEKDSGTNAKTTNSSSKLESKIKKIEDNKNLISCELPSTAVSSTSTAVSSTSTAGRLQNKNPPSTNHEEVHVEEIINSNTKFQYCETEISQLSNMMSSDFKAFTAKCVPLTGDEEVDEEIIKFYRSRYQIFKNK